MKKKYYVYMHLYQDKPVYIGKGSVNYSKCKTKGGYDCRANNKTNRRSQEYLDFIKMVGKENIEVKIIARFDNEEDALWLEEELHKVHKDLFSMVTRGEMHPLYNKPRSVSTRQKLSKANKGANNPRARKVIMLDKINNKHIRIFDCIVDALEYLDCTTNNTSNITKCCTGEGLTALGYKWMYLEDYENKTELYYKIINNKSDVKRSNNHNARKIIMLDKNIDVVIKQFDCITDAIDYLQKGNTTNLSACCRGKQKTAFGYRWMYADDYLKLNKFKEIA
ncbi:Intron encoded nuclease repeat motif [Romboutsia ilealis]|uniref:Intron encoded nuclease repeat motif n=1 Tax=Romboutsia ilealis TaxID=1115758 RepID=A0A1V1HZ51_9FIRM|nr:NUMOD3 domain-containing DNA-binding protein [Romboutsia ilealis]CED93252.1 Intron encoded nuclease repeat motif [Romboutsia ilealis]